MVAPGLFKSVVAIAPVTDPATLLESTRYTSNYYFLKEHVIGTGPHLVTGSPAKNAAKIIAPVLMFSGTFDANVPVAQAKLMDGRLREAGKNSELVLFDGLDHQLDDSIARATLLKRSADFMLAGGK